MNAYDQCIAHAATVLTHTIRESDHKVRHENLVLSTEVNRLNIKSIYLSKKVEKRMFRGLALLQSG